VTQPQGRGKFLLLILSLEERMLYSSPLPSEAVSQLFLVGQRKGALGTIEICYTYSLRKESDDGISLW
jgi:hypothetical protein